MNRVIEELRSEIEERKRIEARVREQARLLDLAHDAIVVQDLEGKILYWNKGAESIYGWAAAEVLGASLAARLGWEQAAYATARQTVQAQGYWEGEISALAKHGRKVLIDAGLDPGP